MDTNSSLSGSWSRSLALRITGPTAVSDIYGVAPPRLVLNYSRLRVVLYTRLERSDNAAGIMTVDENLFCSFQILKGATADYKFPRWGLNMHGSECLVSS
jgi:hypothetical protein